MPPASFADLRINGARLQASIDALARIGSTGDGGVCRLAFTPEDRAGRDFVAERLAALGLTPRIDGVGNLLALRPGATDGPAVLSGSHTDTVATGGRYDGALGVLTALEALTTLHEAGLTTERPVGLISFVNEEGARFTPGLTGSAVLMGHYDPAEARTHLGRDGTRLGDALKATAYAGQDDFTDLAIDAFVELHIEQGPILERAQAPIGVVTAVQGITWLDFALTGQANHAGATPMDARHDAGLVAAQIAQHCRTLAQAMGPAQRVTAGGLSVYPNLPNVIPGRARVTVDLRHPSAVQLQEAERRLRHFAQAAAEAEGVHLQVDVQSHLPPTTFDPALVTLIERTAHTLGYGSRRLTSGGGHDAMLVAAHHPAAMVFVPSVGGVSHTPTEYTRPADAEAGANVVLHTLLARAGVVG